MGLVCGLGVLFCPSWALLWSGLFHEFSAGCWVCVLVAVLFLVPVIVILISRGVLSNLMVQLSLQWFLLLCEARSFVDVVENLQEVQCSSAFLSCSCYSQGYSSGFSWFLWASWFL